MDMMANYGGPVQQDGVLVLNKPKGLSSAACVGIIKRKLGQKKIGHGGTLDPSAEGVLLILLGQATKIASLLLEEGEKIYSGVVKFGVSTDTWDAEGEVTGEGPADAVSEEALRKAVAEFTAVTEQDVPPYSAAKHQGKALYKLAREGKEVPRKRKAVKISRAELEWFEPPLARFRVACGSGTYIRSLAHSLGIRFGCGATLMELTREYSHPFGLADAVALDELTAAPERLPTLVRGISEALPGLARLTVTPAQARGIRNGNAIPVMQLPDTDKDKALLVDETGGPLALAVKKVELRQLVWGIGRGLWNN